MNHCILCQQAPYQDDPCCTIYASGVGTVQCCTPCACREEGRDLPPPRTYPVGSRIPLKPNSDGPIDICGVCRRALRMGESPALLRLHTDDVAGHGIAPGCYASCPRCIAIYRPVIHARLLRQQEPGAPLLVADCVGGWLG